MSKWYESRSDESVAEAFLKKDKEVAVDIPSEDDEEEDREIMMTDTGSEEEEEEEGEEGEGSVLEPAIELKHEYDSEDYEPEETGETPTAPKRGRKSNHGAKRKIIQGRDGHRWFSTAQEESRHRRKTSFKFLPGPIGEARTVTTPLEAWRLLFDEKLLEKVEFHTNEEFQRFRESSETELVSSTIYNGVELPELLALFGLMYFAGLQNTSKTNLEDLWSHEYGSELYRATMPLKRFKLLSRMLRFDEKATRAARRETDNFAPIREVWEDFISNCTKNYTPAPHCTIDEQLLSFRGRCPFKVYSGNKPDRYGIKIIMLNDSKTFYMHNAEPYVGRVMTEGEETAQGYYVRKLSEPIHGTMRNISCNNRFSSVQIFDKMLREYSLTMVGIVRKNLPQIPSMYKEAAGEIHCSKFAFSNNQTLVSYTPKKNKVILLLSTLHHSAEINGETNKPEILEFYDATKGGTDSFDHMCHEYTTARKTLRWPMRVWMGMLDQGRINAMVLYNYNAANLRLNRRDFLKALVMGLVEPHLHARLNIQTLRRDLRLSIENILKIEPKPATVLSGPTKRTRCGFCPRTNDRKVRIFCEICNRPVCEDHRSTLCNICAVRN